MGWLWSGRGKPRSRPRVARAIVEARDAHASVATNLGGATALMERAIWTHQLPTYPAYTESPAERGVWDDLAGARPAVDVWLGGVAPARKRDFGEVGLLLERAEDTARKLGRSRAEMWEEALRAWLESQSVGAFEGAFDGARSGSAAPAESEAERAPRPWLFEARRQRVWGEIDDTLGALRTA